MIMFDMIDVFIKDVINNEPACKIGIYPYGYWGEIVKNRLCEKYSDINICIYDDLKYREMENVFPISSLVEQEDENFVLMLCAEDRYLAKNKYAAAKRYISEKKIYSLFNEAINSDSILDVVNFDTTTKTYKLNRFDIKMYLPNWDTDAIQRQIVLNDSFFEMEYLSFIRKTFSEKISGGCVLDVGANIGNHSLFLSVLCGARKVVAFEPIKDTYEILVKNVEINELQNVITPINAAVGEYNSHGKIAKMNLSNIGTTRIDYSEDGDIQVISLDSFKEIENEIISLIKIDVEGFEKNVIKGALSIIEKHHPIILVESYAKDGNIEYIYEFLSRNKYRVLHWNADSEDYIFY